VNATGNVFYIATDGRTIVQHTVSGELSLQGAATRVSVGPSGHPWVLNAANQIYRDVSTTAGTTTWQRMPGAATAIGVGANGTVWAIGSGGVPYRWDDTNSKWLTGTGAGKEIAVDPSGNPWVVNAAGQTWQFTNGAWKLLPNLPAGTATDIGIAGDGTAYVVGSDGHVWKWSSTAWADTAAAVPGGRITAGGSYVYVVSATKALKTTGAP
jgi:hypothetical protein